MKFRNAALAATMLALPLTAKAQNFMGVPFTGLYVGAGLGVNIMQDEDAQLRTFAPTVTDSGKLETRVGPAANVYVGGSLYGLRLEVEGAYRYNTFHGNGVGGQEQKFGPMVNVLYDLTGLVPYVAPYVGVGVGYQWVQDRNVYVAGPGGVIRGKTGTNGSLAYQGIIGAALPVSPSLAITADYRFMGLVGTRDYQATGTLVGVPGTVPAQIRLGGDYNHTIMIGVRYTFGAAPPPPPAPAATAVPPSPISRSYLVFFDWDKATLTDRARQIVAEAAANSTKVQYTRIEVNGYTDTSGTPRYNQGLSVRRAEAVAAELVKDGVPRNAIAIQGFGETHLLVPTGPGVREPQNRRVEIIIK
ncbi:MAG TPA: OmpA family protein [Rhodopila sp.]|nr:OmpA family protein [Rhodopila sp.]